MVLSEERTKLKEKTSKGKVSLTLFSPWRSLFIFIGQIIGKTHLMVQTAKSCSEYTLFSMLGAECIIINLNHRVSIVIFYLFIFVFVFPFVYFSFYFIFLFLKD